VPLPGLLIGTDTASDDAVAPVMAAVAAAAEFNIWAEPEATAVVLGDEARGQLLVDRCHFAAAPSVTLVRG
jgi:inosine-uridine nucleoside N-ribohydrolase